MKDTTQIKVKQTENFLADCVNMFTPKAPEEHNEKIVNKFFFTSIALNVISGLIAFALVAHLTGQLMGAFKAIAISLCVFVLVLIELGKRAAFHSAAMKKTTENKIPALLIIGSLALFVTSATISYMGGEKIPAIMKHPPPKEINSEITNIDNEIATINNSIKAQEQTTWKKAITRQANKNIAGYNNQKQALINRKLFLQSEDDRLYQEVLSEYNTQIMNFGYITGVAAVIADIILFFLLFQIVGLKYEVALSAGAVPTPGQIKQSVSKLIAQQSPSMSAYTTQKIGFRLPQSTHARTHAGTHTHAHYAPTRTQVHAHTHAGTRTRTHAHAHTRTKKGDKIPCKQCGKNFLAKGPRNKFCSKECRENK